VGFALVGVLVLIFGGCTVQSMRDPCFFDPMPGEQWNRTITNDSSTPVSVVACDDARCRRGYNEAPIAAGDEIQVIVEACSEETYAVVDPTTHVVLGCLREPGDLLNPPEAAVDRRVTQRHACDGAQGRPFVIQIYDPSK
jgi:hypothetical protein